MAILPQPTGEKATKGEGKEEKTKEKDKDVIDVMAYFTKLQVDNWTMGTDSAPKGAKDGDPEIRQAHLQVCADSVQSIT